MNSTFKLSLMAAAFAFALPATTMAATHGHRASHVANHKVRHGKSHKSRHHHSAYNQDKDSQNQATRDLNARSLQTAQSVNRDPNTGVLAPQSPAGQQPSTPVVGQPPMQSSPSVNGPINASEPPTMGAPVGPANAQGAVNPNNMPPAN